MKQLIRKILKEEHSNVYDPTYYLDDFYSMDFMEEMYDEGTALEKIQEVIDYVRGVKYPIKVYRGINTISPDEDYDNSSWSTDIRVAEGFGDKIFVGLIPDENVIDVEQTIRTRVMNPHEYEFYVPNFNDVEIIDIYEK